jgi:hypothetical protein
VELVCHRFCVTRGAKSLLLCVRADMIFVCESFFFVFCAFIFSSGNHIETVSGRSLFLSLPCAHQRAFVAASAFAAPRRLFSTRASSSFSSSVAMIGGGATAAAAVAALTLMATERATTLSRVAFCDAAPKAAAAAPALAAAGKPAPTKPAAPAATAAAAVATQAAPVPASGSKPAAAAPAAAVDSAAPATTAAATAEDDDEGEIDLECNCVRNMKQGPCAEAFMTSGRCYNASKVSPLAGSR